MVFVEQLVVQNKIRLVEKESSLLQNIQIFENMKNISWKRFDIIST